MTTRTPSTWTVGHDGSAGAGHALDWALARAEGRRVDLRLVRTWQIPAIDFPFPAPPIEEFGPHQVCADVADVQAVADRLGITLTQRIVQGPATRVLLDESEDTDVLVVGSRGLGGFRRLLLGSVSSQCATHARIPTVVVPPSATTDHPICRIVVGLDGSERSRQALRWAIDFAPEDCTILVVGAWMPSRSGYVAVAEHYTDELGRARSHFHEILDRIESETTATVFERRFAFQDPATTLLDAVDGAGLVVVGQRGHSGLSAAILGSVTTHVLHHSPIPVAVIPGAG